MSKRTNQEFYSWKDVEESLLRCVSQNGELVTGLSPRDKDTVLSAVLLWTLATKDTLSSLRDPAPLLNYQRWFNFLTTLKFRELVSCLKRVSMEMIHLQVDTYDGFKRHLRQDIPQIGGILSPVKEIFDLWFTSKEPEHFSLIYSWLLFLSRVSLKDDPTLAEEALSKYLAIEDSFSDSMTYTESEGDLIRQWFPNDSVSRYNMIQNFSPQHGPGATSDSGSLLYSKYQNLGCDNRIHLLRNLVGINQPRCDSDVFQRRSKTIFVPKDANSYRTISMEPATLMWYQKGVRAGLLHQLMECPLRTRVPLQDQTLSHEKTWIGSIDGSYATIDLSSASDMVSWRLVRQWFDRTSLIKWLLCTRSTHTQLPNGEVLELKKFAPMGSDLSFPIESIVFSAIVECTIRELDADTIDYCVYGDDIIVEDQYYNHVVDRLERNGFAINKDKSFSSRQSCGFFRESCGVFYLDGVDVTPLRLPRNFRGLRLKENDTPEGRKTITALANRCSHRYPSVRLYLIHWFNNLGIRYRVPFSCDGETGLWSPQPTNHHLRSRYSDSLQCTQYQFSDIEMRQRDVGLDGEDIRLFEYLRLVQDRKRLTWPEDRVDVRLASKPPRSVWKTKWAGIY